MNDNLTSVFISYRRSISKYVARLIFNALQARGYSTFIDIENIDSGYFDQIILNQIAARAHFILILSPGSLDRINEPDDWLRREIEHAIKMNRNIVPVFADGFNFSDRELPESIQSLKRFNGLSLHYDYFDEGMDRLCKRFLKQPVYGQIIPAPEEEQKIVDKKIREVKRALAQKAIGPAQRGPLNIEKRSPYVVAGVTLLLIFICFLLSSLSFRGWIGDLFSRTTPSSLSLSEAPVQTMTETFQLTPEELATSTATIRPINTRTSIPTRTPFNTPSPTIDPSIRRINDALKFMRDNPPDVEENFNSAGEFTLWGTAKIVNGFLKLYHLDVATIDPFNSNYLAIETDLTVQGDNCVITLREIQWGSQKNYGFVFENTKGYLVRRFESLDSSMNLGGYDSNPALSNNAAANVKIIVLGNLSAVLLNNEIAYTANDSSELIKFSHQAISAEGGEDTLCSADDYKTWDLTRFNNGQ